MSDISNQPKMPPSKSTPMSRAMGDLLRRVRRTAGMSMGDMARVIGCSVVRVSDIETGEVEATAFEIDRYSGAIEPVATREGE